MDADSASERDLPGRHNRCASLPEFVRQPSAPTRIVTTGNPVVTMRWNPRQHWVLAQFFEFQDAKKLSYRLKQAHSSLAEKLARLAEYHFRPGALNRYSITIAALAQGYSTTDSESAVSPLRGDSTDIVPRAQRKADCISSAFRLQFDCESTAQFDFNLAIGIEFMPIQSFLNFSELSARSSGHMLNRAAVRTME